LSSEDTGAYGRDIGTSLPQLLWQLIAVLPEHVMLRVGMTNPPYILEHLQVRQFSSTAPAPHFYSHQEMSLILRHPRVYAFLHVPVQAASDRVLEVMKRKYSLAEFCTVVDTLQELVPDINIATDVRKNRGLVLCSLTIL
jgi:threonylcarbamoyladenosine tRNA methylthiotransferase CDKAL1